jgi:hypothetical protein
MGMGMELVGEWMEESLEELVMNSRGGGLPGPSDVGD